jgi:hypothetical protein
MRSFGEVETLKGMKKDEDTEGPFGGFFPSRKVIL